MIKTSMILGKEFWQMETSNKINEIDFRNTREKNFCKEK